MSLRDSFRKAAGLFIEVSPDPASTPDVDLTLPENATLPPVDASAKTVEHLVRDSAGPNLDEITVATPTPSGLIVAGDVDLTALYAHARVPAAPFTAEQTLDMLTSLPKELPLETRRQTVKATLAAMGKAIGATQETIVADASRKMAALTTYVDSLQGQCDEFNTATAAEIAALQAQIAEKQHAIETNRRQHEQIIQTCHATAEHLDEVLEFFSLDVAPSKYAEKQGAETKK